MWEVRGVQQTSERVPCWAGETEAQGKQRAAQGHPAKAGSDPCGLPSGSGLVQSPPCVPAEGRLPTCLPEGQEVDSRHLLAKWSLPGAY